MFEDRNVATKEGRRTEGWGVSQECIGRVGQFLPVDVVGDNCGRCERQCSNREEATEG